MKILSIEASGPVAGCALLDGDVLVAEYSTQYKKKHSQSLVPMLDEMCRMIDLELSGIDAISVTAGPGSFTGLRIGAATVKGLGLALEKPVIPVPTVDSLACNVFGTERLVCPLMDARRSQVSTGVYEFGPGYAAPDSAAGNGCALKIRREQCVVPVREIAEYLNSIAQKDSGKDREVLFLGDGVPVSRDALREMMRVPYIFAPPHMDRQRASSTAVRAAQLYAEKGDACLVSADAFRPEYLRLPQAERERGSKRDYTICS